jgi:mono/diheme cytochrome c family protein
VKSVCLKILIVLGTLMPITTAFAADPGSNDVVMRGQYLVNHVAMCVECHTPRNDKGELLPGKYLRGAPVAVDRPPYPNMKWAIIAPGIVGLGGYTDEQGVRLLTEGITADGRVPNPPMPRFRFTREDAAAIVDYLKSLK